MRVGVLRGNGLSLARGAAVLLVCSAAAGCSSTASRFGLDGLFTGSTTTDATSASAAQSAPAAPIAAAPAAPVERSDLAPPSAPGPSVTAEASRAPAPTRKLAQSAAPVPSQPPAERVAMAQPSKPKQPTPKPAKAEVAVEKKAVGEGGYTVASGDSWNKIAAKTGVAVTDLKAANGGRSQLQVGQALSLPKAGAKSADAGATKPAPTLDPLQTAATKPAASAEKVAYTPPQPAKQAIAEAEQSDKAEAPDASGVGKMRWPVRGRVLGRYGAKGSQASDGIDIAVPEGTPVKAAENGVVIYAGDGLKEFGNTVLVRHENGLVTVYGHASQIKVTRGEKVTRGQDIALSGMSGTTDTPKLHFEVRKNSAPVDPVTFLQ